MHTGAAHPVFYIFYSCFHNHALCFLIVQALRTLCTSSSGPGSLGLSRQDLGAAAAALTSVLERLAGTEQGQGLLMATVPAVQVSREHGVMGSSFLVWPAAYCGE